MVEWVKKVKCPECGLEKGIVIRSGKHREAQHLLWRCLDCERLYSEPIVM